MSYNNKDQDDTLLKCSRKGCGRLITEPSSSVSLPCQRIICRRCTFENREEKRAGQLELDCSMCDKKHQIADLPVKVEPKPPPGIISGELQELLFDTLKCSVDDCDNLISSKPVLQACCQQIVCKTCAFKIREAQLTGQLGEQDCLVCHEKHQISDLPLVVEQIERVAEIVERAMVPNKAKNIKLSPINIHFKLKELMTEVNRVEFMLKKTYLTTYDDHLENLKFEVDIQREEVIQSIHDVSNHMIKQLDKHTGVVDAHFEAESQLEKEFRFECGEWKQELEHLLESGVEQQTQETLEQIETEINERRNDVYKEADIQAEARYFDWAATRKQFSFVKEFQIAFGSLRDYWSLRCSSILINQESEALSTLCNSSSSATFEFKMVYQASRDGHEAKHFHEKCDKLGESSDTLTIIETEKNEDHPVYVLGGYTKASWKGQGFKKDSSAWLFMFLKRNGTPTKFKCAKPDEAIRRDPTFGAVFGDGDLTMVGTANGAGRCNLGKGTYRQMTYDEHCQTPYSFMNHFTAKHVETYQLKEIEADKI